jgi:nucleoid-associated protein YgaU
MVDVLYTVQPSDENGGLLAIASRLYGDASRWTEIYEANQSVIGNNPNVIHKGQQLLIPRLEERGVGTGRIRLYIVQHSDLRDGLRGIARLLYGDETRWQEIHAVNYGVVGNDPSLLQVGQILIIP